MCAKQTQIYVCSSAAEEPAGISVQCVASVVGLWAVNFQKYVVCVAFAAHALFADA